MPVRPDIEWYQALDIEEADTHIRTIRQNREWVILFYRDEDDPYAVFVEGKIKGFFHTIKEADQCILDARDAYVAGKSGWDKPLSSSPFGTQSSSSGFGCFVSLVIIAVVFFIIASVSNALLPKPYPTEKYGQPSQDTTPPPISVTRIDDNEYAKRLIADYFNNSIGNAVVKNTYVMKTIHGMELRKRDDTNADLCASFDYVISSSPTTGLATDNRLFHIQMNGQTWKVVSMDGFESCTIA